MVHKTDVYKSLSVLAPVCRSCTVLWRIKAFTGYFGDSDALCQWSGPWLKLESCEICKTVGSAAMYLQTESLLLPLLLLLLLLCVIAGEDNKELWAAHDATELVKKYQGPSLPTLVDTGVREFM